MAKMVLNYVERTGPIFRVGVAGEGTSQEALDLIVNETQFDREWSDFDKTEDGYEFSYEAGHYLHD